MLLPKITSYIELADRYDIFVFDLWGVLHNGVVLYDQTIKFIQHLRLLGKRILFLSNNPRPSSFAIQHLVQKGFFLAKNEVLFTSGDFFRFCYQNNFHNMFIPNKKIYNLGEEFNSDLLMGLDVEKVTDMLAADYILLSIFTDIKDELNKWDRELTMAAKKKIPAICANPDIIAPQGHRIRYTPGTFAKKYYDLGGQVYYFGKPYQDIYHHLLDPIISEERTDKSKILAIGDSLEMDIKGAAIYGIDSLLLLNDMHAEDNSDSDHGLDWMLKSVIKPTFVMNEPKFDLVN